MKQFLMCEPEHFAVEYAINPWMDPTRPVDTERAVAQWTTLYELYLALGHIHVELGERPQAKGMFQRGLEVDPRHEGLREALTRLA